MKIFAKRPECLVIFFLLTLGSGWLLPESSWLSVASAADQRQIQPHGSFVSLSAEQAAELMRTREDLLVVDVRTLKERKEAAIKGSVHIPMNDIFRDEVPLSADRPILLYCAVGGRSRAVAIWLQKKGFTELYNLGGGIVDWQKKGFPVEREK